MAKIPSNHAIKKAGKIDETQQGKIPKKLDNDDIYYIKVIDDKGREVKRKIF